jgi:hypothetical protein
MTVSAEDDLACRSGAEPFGEQRAAGGDQVVLVLFFRQVLAVVGGCTVDGQNIAVKIDGCREGVQRKSFLGQQSCMGEAVGGHKVLHRPINHPSIVVSTDRRKIERFE